MMRVVLIGADGFLGSAVRDEFACRHPDVAVTGVVRRVAVPTAGDARCVIDVAGVDVPELRALLEAHRPDAIVNCAGATVGSTELFERANVQLVSKLIEASVVMQDPPRLIQIGSGAEYGITPHGTAVQESDEARPVSPYGMSKARATDLVCSASSHFGLAGIVLRVFNPIGPGTPAATLAGNAARTIEQALRDGVDTVELGPLDAFRDFVDVRDVARAIVVACARERLPSGVFNIGSGHATLTRDLVSMIADAAGYAGQVRELARGSDRSTGVGWQQADISKAREHMGWLPMIPLDESVTAIWADCARRGLATVGG